MESISKLVSDVQKGISDGLKAEKWDFEVVEVSETKMILAFEDGSQMTVTLNRIEAV